MIDRDLVLRLVRGATRGGFFPALVDQGLNSLVSLFAAVLVARVLGKEALAVFAVATSARLIVITLQNSLFVTPVTILIGSVGLHARPTLVARMGLLQGLVLLTGLSLAIVVDLLVPLPLSAAAAYVLAGAVLEYGRRCAYWCLRPLGATLAASANAALVATTCLLLLHWDMLSLSAVLLIVAASNTVAGLLAFPFAGLAGAKFNLLGWFHDWRRDFLPYGKWNAFSNFSGYLASQAHVYLALILLGPVAVALLEVARQAMAPMSLMLSGFASIYQIRLSEVLNRSGSSALANTVLQASVFQVALFLPYLLLVWFAPELVLSVLLGPQVTNYEQAIPLVPIFSLSLVALAMGQYYSFGVFVLRQPRRAAIGRTFSSLVGVALLWVMMEQQGLFGAAWGRFVIEGIIVLVSFVQFRLALRTFDSTSSQFGPS